MANIKLQMKKEEKHGLDVWTSSYLLLDMLLVLATSGDFHTYVIKMEEVSFSYGSFLIPYITFMILGALPMYLLEYSLGQFSSNGPISVWKICPLMKGIGYAMVIVSAIFCIYFNVMMGYVLYFLYHSLTSVLPWSTCDNEWNTEFCYISQTTNTSTSNISSITGNNTGDLKMSSSEEFWR
ncbi:unnamed protein product [Mytilus edulis]|uniref:Uncharacterized protein n=1 Tax=Mytilus edulis TaxID=6550 RepID=A0A8S3R088_MYTED|nr:unnamed protein product [Mytilus edulis]